MFGPKSTDYVEYVEYLQVQTEHGWSINLLFLKLHEYLRSVKFRRTTFIGCSGRVKYVLARLVIFVGGSTKHRICIEDDGHFEVQYNRIRR